MAINKRVQASPSKKSSFRNSLAIYVDRRDDGSVQTFQLDALEACKHIAWRIAHFHDKWRDADEPPTAQDFAKFLGDERVVLAFPRDEDGNTRLAYELRGFRGIAIPADMITEEADLPALSKRISGFDDYMHSEISRLDGLALKVLPEKPEKGQEAFFHAPTPADKKEFAKPIQAALGAGLAETYLGLSGKDAVVNVRLRATGFDKDSRRWIEEPYSKVFTPRSDGGFDRLSNTSRTQFEYYPQASNGLDELVDKSFETESFTVIGRPVIYERRRAFRRKLSNADSWKYGPGKNDRDFPDGVVKYRCNQAFGDDLAKEVAWAPTRRWVFAGLMEQEMRIVPLDIDAFKLSRKYDLRTEADAAFAEARAQLPEAFQNVRARCSLSSSAGFTKREEEGNVYDYEPVTDRLRGRLWFEFDEPIEPMTFKKMIGQLRPGLVDGALYSAPQAIYGAPVFRKGAQDPLEDVRHTTLPGKNKVELGHLQAEHAVVQEQIERERANKAPSPAPGSRTHRDQRRLETDGSKFRSAFDVLGILGDREQMLKATGYDDHFGALRYIIRRHLHAAYDERPFLEPLNTLDVADPPDTDLGTHISVLNSAVALQLKESAADSTRSTTPDHFVDLDISEDGVVEPGGKYADLVASCCQHIADERQERADAFRRKTRTRQEMDPSDIEGFRKACLLETDTPGVCIEWQTKSLVIDPGDCLYIDAPNTPERQKMITAPGVEKSIAIFPETADTRSKVDQLKFVDSFSEMIDQDATNGHALKSGYAFVTGIDPEIARERKKEQYPAGPSLNLHSSRRLKKLKQPMTRKPQPAKEAPAERKPEQKLEEKPSNQPTPGPNLSKLRKRMKQRGGPKPSMSMEP